MTAPSEQVAPVMSVKDWLITSLIMIVPIVGFVMLFVWAFGDNANPNKANWAKAALLLSAIAVAFYILIFAVVGAAILGTAS
ncbi:hypothetical protein D770_16145 [Flammeovirgaceae bacterium 311]|nr:hypothetical protein D770_16145 [Flammeovirgaceae bacterium 311]